MCGSLELLKATTVLRGYELVIFPNLQWPNGNQLVGSQPTTDFSSSLPAFVSVSIIHRYPVLTLCSIIVHHSSNSRNGGTGCHDAWSLISTNVICLSIEGCLLTLPSDFPMCCYGTTTLPRRRVRLQGTILTLCPSVVLMTMFEHSARSCTCAGPDLSRVIV